MTFIKKAKNGSIYTFPSHAEQKKASDNFQRKLNKMMPNIKRLAEQIVEAKLDFEGLAITTHMLLNATGLSYSSERRVYQTAKDLTLRQEILNIIVYDIKTGKLETHATIPKEAYAQEKRIVNRKSR